MKFILITILCICMASGTPLAASSDDRNSSESNIYEVMTMSKLSQLYWGIKRLDLNNNIHIDNYMRINECDIFNEYINNEFEWVEVRKSAKAFIKENAGSFPLRFEIMQPIEIGQYNIEKEEFYVIEEDRIDAMRRFFVQALDANSTICGESEVIRGYPRAIVLEISRPFNFQTFKLGKEKAREYIEAHTQSIKNASSVRRRPRSIYLVFKVKIFADQGNVKGSDNQQLAAVLAVLEGIEIYADQERTDLLHSETFRTRSNKRKKPLVKKEPAPSKKGTALSLDNY